MDYFSPRYRELQEHHIELNELLDKFYEYGTDCPIEALDILTHACFILDGVEPSSDEKEDLVGELRNWLRTNMNLIERIFLSFYSLREEMSKVLLGDFVSDIEDNQQILGGIHTFYGALFGLWLIDEYEPIGGEAWSYLSYVIEELDVSNFAMIREFIGANLLDTQSLNPIQELWKKILSVGE